MVTSLSCLLLLSLAPAQKGDLQIVNARPTYGYLGPTRPPTGAVPGETFHFTFEIKGMSQDKNGQVFYSLLMEVLNEKGETYFKLGPRKAVARNFLGGATIPCSAHLDVPVDAPPGAYTLRVSIEDRKTKKKAVFEKTGKILPMTFHLVNVATFADAPGKVPASPVGIVGESRYIGFSAVGFARDKKTDQPNIDMQLKIYDAKGNPTMAQPLSGNIKEGVPENAKILPNYTVGFTLTKTGRFTVELTATDKISGKTSKVSFPIQVVPAP